MYTIVALSEIAQGKRVACHLLLFTSWNLSSATDSTSPSVWPLALPDNSFFASLSLTVGGGFRFVPLP